MAVVTRVASGCTCSQPRFSLAKPFASDKLVSRIFVSVLTRFCALAGTAQLGVRTACSSSHTSSQSNHLLQATWHQAFPGTPGLAQQA